MITSLNVNNFLGQNDWNVLKGNHNEKARLWDKYKEFHFNYIDKHLVNQDDIVILHEVPYVKEQELILNYGQVIYKRKQKCENKVMNDDICEIFKSLMEFCDEKKFEIITPKSNETSYSRTIAICRKGKYEYLKYGEEFPEYKNRIISIKNNSKDLVILGCHAPSSGGIDIYWNSLISVCNTLIAEKFKNIIVIGDLNVYMPATPQKGKLYSLLSKGFVDLWLEKGYSHIDPTYVKETRIDYAVVSDKLYDKFEIEKDDSVREGRYSDHSAIILKPIM